MLIFWNKKMNADQRKSKKRSRNEMQRWLICCEIVGIASTSLVSVSRVSQFLFRLHQVQSGYWLEIYNFRWNCTIASGKHSKIESNWFNKVLMSCVWHRWIVRNNSIGSKTSNSSVFLLIRWEFKLIFLGARIVSDNWQRKEINEVGSNNWVA